MDAFYQRPLFMWLLIFVFPPIGIFCLWMYKHYNFIIRCLITVFFFNAFRFNTFISLTIIVIVIVSLLDMHHQVVNKAQISKTIEAPVEVKPIDFSQLNMVEFSELCQQVFINGDYQVVASDAKLELDFIIKLGFKSWGVKLIHQADILRQDVSGFAYHLAEHNLKQGILITSLDYSLYASELSDQLNIILWNQAILNAKLAQFNH
jgi:hypothetical protein